MAAKSGSGLKAYRGWYHPQDVALLRLEAARESVETGRSIDWFVLVRRLIRREADRLRATQTGANGCER